MAPEKKEEISDFRANIRSCFHVLLVELIALKTQFSLVFLIPSFSFSSLREEHHLQQESVQASRHLDAAQSSGGQNPQHTLWRRHTRQR